MGAVLWTIVVAGLPVFGLLYYFWHRDKGEKEPVRLMRKVFLWGVLAIVPVAIMEFAIFYGVSLAWTVPPLWIGILIPFIFVALPEEYFKLWVVKKKAYNEKKFNEIMDGVTYCILASMGFALFENIMYIFQYGVETGILRAFTAVPAHALFSGLMGTYIGRAKFAKDPQQEKILFRKGLMAGVFFHGLYDFLLMSGVPYLIALVFPLLFYMSTQLHFAIRLANAKRAEALDYF